MRTLLREFALPAAILAWVIALHAMATRSTRERRENHAAIASLEARVRALEVRP